MNSPFRRSFFCACPLTSPFLNLYTNAYKLNISVISSSGLKLPPEGACQTVVAFKVIANSKSQTASLLLHSSENTFMKSDSRSRWAALTQLLCSLCLFLISALGTSLFLLIYNRLCWGRRTPKVKTSELKHHRAWILCSLKWKAENNTWLQSAPSKVQRRVKKASLFGDKSMPASKTGRGILCLNSSLQWNNETKCDN